MKNFNKLCLFLFSFLFLIISVPAFSHDSMDKNPMDIFPSIGFSPIINKQDIQIEADKDKILDNFSTFKKLEIIRSFGKEKDAFLSPFSWTYMLSLVYSYLFILDYYYNNIKHNSQINIKVFIIDHDLYGKSISHLAYSFSFNKNIFLKIDWHDFDFNNIPKIASHFKTTAWLNNKLNNERFRLSNSDYDYEMESEN